MEKGREEGREEGRVGGRGERRHVTASSHAARGKRVSVTQCLRPMQLRKTQKLCQGQCCGEKKHNRNVSGLCCWIGQFLNCFETILFNVLVIQ